MVDTTSPALARAYRARAIGNALGFYAEICAHHAPGMARFLAGAYLARKLSLTIHEAHELIALSLDGPLK